MNPNLALNVNVEKKVTQPDTASDKWRRLYETLLSTTPDFVYSFDLNHRFTYANPALLTMWGKSWDEAIGKTCLELGYEPWHAAMHDRELEEVIQYKKTVRGEVAFTGTNGRRLYDYIFSPVLNKSGEVEAVAGTTRDVTDQRQGDNQRAIAANAMRHLATIVESSDDAIISKNLSSIITSWNRGAERIFGYKAEEVIGKSILTLIPPSLHKEEPIILKKLQQGERINHYQTVRRCKDGRLIDVSLTVSPILNADGKVIGASKIARDITEQKKIQESLTRINQELKDLTINLERRVEERTARLEEQSEQLRRLAVELTEAEESERKRLAQVLHDHLQQLLVAAKMRIDLMEGREKDAAVKRSFAELRGFIEEAFNSSRTLTAELRPPVLYEGGLIPALRFLARKFHDQYKFTVHVTAGPDAEPASGFLKAMIYSMAREIIFNAVKYAKVTECDVHLCRVAAVNGICMTIADKGVGFDSSVIGRKNSEGFGLFSIRERIRALGGDFKIMSDQGTGAKFEICIPDDHPDEAIAAKEMAKNVPVSSLPMNKSGGLTILLVDDHKILRQSLANLLSSQGFIGEIREAEDGVDAVEKAAGNPDVIIMDLNMPRLNGIEAIKIIHERYPAVKIIGLSVQSEPETRQTALDSGAIAYFHKGEETDVLIEALREIALANANR